jgi:hypothetical protein
MVTIMEGAPQASGRNYEIEEDNLSQSKAHPPMRYLTEQSKFRIKMETGSAEITVGTKPHPAGGIGETGLQVIFAHPKHENIRYKSMQGVIAALADSVVESGKPGGPVFYRSDSKGCTLFNYGGIVPGGADAETPAADMQSRLQRVPGVTIEPAKEPWINRLGHMLGKGGRPAG